MSLIDKELILYLTLVHMNKYTRAQHTTELQGKNNIANKSEKTHFMYHKIELLFLLILLYVYTFLNFPIANS